MQQIGFLLYPGFQIMSLAAVSAFEFANIELEEKVYEVRYLSEHGGPIANSLGMVMETEAFGDPALDTLIVAGAPGIRLPNAA
ncbi:GlxA family transcriptional regulator, partial [Rhizobium ruizarguesonis]